MKCSISLPHEPKILRGMGAHKTRVQFRPSWSGVAWPPSNWPVSQVPFCRHPQVSAKGFLIQVPFGTLVLCTPDPFLKEQKLSLWWVKNTPSTSVNAFYLYLGAFSKDSPRTGSDILRAGGSSDLTVQSAGVTRPWLSVRPTATHWFSLFSFQHVLMHCCQIPKSNYSPSSHAWWDIPQLSLDVTSVFIYFSCYS